MDGMNTNKKFTVIDDKNARTSHKNTTKFEYEFEIKLASGKTVNYFGSNGMEACQRYVNNNPEEVAIAWRYPKYEFKIGMIRIAD
jgi:hypothetical protein